MARQNIPTLEIFQQITNIDNLKQSLAQLITGPNVENHISHILCKQLTNEIYLGRENFD